VSNSPALAYGSAYNTITLTPRAGDESYAIYRIGTPGVLALVPNTSSTSGPGTALTFVDYGQTPITGMPTIPDSPPSSALADTLVTTIVSGAGTTSVTLAAAATTAVTSAAVFHDDCHATFQAAANAMGPAGTIFAPPVPGAYGGYVCSSPIKVVGAQGLHFVGAGKQGISSGTSTLIYASRMMAGLPVFSFKDSSMSGVENLAIFGSTAGPAIAAIESRAAAGGNAHEMIYKDLFLNGQWDGGNNGGLVEGLLWSADPGSDQDNDESYVENVDIYETSDACVFIGHPESLFHTFVGGNWAYCATGVKQYGGSFSMHGTNLNPTDAVFHAFAGDYGDGGSSVNGAKIELDPGATQVAPGRLLVIDSGANNDPYVVGASYDFQGVTFQWQPQSGTSVNVIDIEASNATVSFDGCALNTNYNGGSGSYFNIFEAAPGDTLRINNSEINFNEITFYGHLYLYGNHSAGTHAASLIPQGTSSVLVDSGNDIGTSHNSGTSLANRGLYLTPQAAGNITGAATFNFKFGNEIDATLTGAVTLTMQNGEPANSSGQEVSVKVCQDSSGNHVLTWPANVKWPGGTAPPNGMTQTASKCDWFGFRYDGNPSTGGGNTFWNLWKSQNL
jgi:hypothetical protein